MSFLLDALGKADHDRRRSEVPELRTYSQTGRSPLRGVLRSFALLSLLCLFFGLGYFSRPFLDRNIFNAETAGSNPVVPQVPENRVTPAVSTPSAPAEVSESAVLQKVARAFDLEVISYSELPTARFVMINGTMLREGEMLGSGETLLTIEPDAVVLDAAGKQIRVGM